ncbi:MAG: peroxiredoxin [Hyphomonadaceae bacterium]|nr:MAG: peroxiredoxin Q/BCP [Caulobacteraceae bacterium]MBT9447830.1 peroxiredoxin [Hyphomonadaceae bacterium]TPW07508.1 MAG: peroxiredoxin Q/BCP [Alphaproteobacteria bacterium]
MSSGLNPGDDAPAFSMPVSGGGHVDLAGLRGKIVVLFFYPKDDTAGCTQEALNFTEKAAEFEALDAVLVGVSRDSVKSHDRFRAKHGLTVVLASDTDGAVTDAYGVWVEKSMYGRKYMGIERSTFLIDRRGKVSRTWRKVKVSGHADDVLAAAQEI